MKVGGQWVCFEDFHVGLTRRGGERLSATEHDCTVAYHLICIYTNMHYSGTSIASNTSSRMVSGPTSFSNTSTAASSLPYCKLRSFWGETIAIRCLYIFRAASCTSEGVTKSRPWSIASNLARRSKCFVARGVTPPATARCRRRKMSTSCK